MPNVKGKEPTSPVVLDLETAQPWKISCIQEGLGGQYDHDTIVEMLRRCRGDIDRAFANLLDEESSASSFVSSTNSAASSQTSATSTASIPKQHISPTHGHNTGPLLANFKPRLISSRSSSRHSTASKRSADDSDGEGVISAGRQRGREQKRRILPKVTVGINFGDQEKPDLVSLRLRVNSDAVAEQISHTPSPLEQPEKSNPNPTPVKGRKLRPRRLRTSVTSEADSTTTISSESPVIKTEE